MLGDSLSIGGCVMGYNLTRDYAGHWLVTKGPNGKPVAVFYTHNVPSYVGKRRAEKFIKAMV